MAFEEATSDVVKRVICESLQLDSNVVISDDTELSGGEYAPDSLDMLLIVTNLEREFGIKIPNAQIGPETFSSVRRIVDFIEKYR